MVESLNKDGVKFKNKTTKIKNISTKGEAGAFGDKSPQEWSHAPKNAFIRRNEKKDREAAKKSAAAA